MLQARYSNTEVKFKFIYIQEAHAKDGWPMPSSRYNPLGQAVNISNHTSLEERVAAAKSLVEGMDMQGEVLVDTMEDSFNTEFSAWPTMFYAISAEGKLVFKGTHEGDKFKTEGLQEWLDGNKRKGAENFSPSVTSGNNSIRVLVAKKKKMLHFSSTGSMGCSPARKDSLMCHVSSTGCLAPQLIPSTTGCCSLL